MTLPDIGLTFPTAFKGCLLGFVFETQPKRQSLRATEDILGHAFLFLISFCLGSGFGQVAMTMHHGLHLLSQLLVVYNAA